MLGKWCGAVTYFLCKKIRKNKYRLHDKMLHCHQLNKEQYNFGKLNLTMLWALVTIYAKEYKAFGPSYNLPKLKKNKTLIYLSKNRYVME